MSNQVRLVIQRYSLVKNTIHTGIPPTIDSQIHSLYLTWLKYKPEDNMEHNHGGLEDPVPF